MDVETVFNGRRLVTNGLAPADVTYDRLLRSVASGCACAAATRTTQQTWLSLRESIHTLRQPDRVQAWLRR